MALDLKNIDLKSIDFRNIYEWPLVGRIIIIGLACFAVFYLGYLFDFSDFSGVIFKKYQQEEDLKHQIKSILGKQADMTNEVSQFPQFEKLLNAWQGQLINAANLPELLNQILKLGTIDQLKFTVFNPGVAEKSGNYFKVPIKVVIQGNYNQVGTFISQIANMPQIVVVGDFVMGKQAERNEEKKNASPSASVGVENPLMTELILEVYYLANKK